MKKQNEKNISKKAMFLRKSNKVMEQAIEDRPVRLGEKVAGDKLIHIGQEFGKEHNELLKKSKSPRNTSGSHSLTALSLFRSK